MRKILLEIISDLESVDPMTVFAFSVCFGIPLLVLLAAVAYGSYEMAYHQ